MEFCSAETAETRFDKPRKVPKGFNLFVRSCCFGVLIRGLKSLGSSRKGKRFYSFCIVQKEPKVHQRFANLWTPGTIQSSAGSDFAKISGGTCRNRFCPQNGGKKALNRCERVAVLLTQDRCFSKKDCCTASLQWVVADEMCDCSLALV